MIFEKKNHRLSRRHAVGSGPCRITPLSGPNGWLTVSGWTDGPACTDGTPSGPLGLRRQHSWPDGPVAGRPWWRATPTAPIFGRRCSIWPSAQGFFPVVCICSNEYSTYVQTNNNNVVGFYNWMIFHKSKLCRGDEFCVGFRLRPLFSSTVTKSFECS
jgi:hypothetical protein